MSTAIATYSGCDRDGGTPVLVTKKPPFQEQFWCIREAGVPEYAFTSSELVRDVRSTTDCFSIHEPISIPRWLVAQRSGRQSLQFHQVTQSNGPTVRVQS